MSGKFRGFSFGVIESDYISLTGRRNIELVAPLADGGLAHYYNDENGWHGGTTFGAAEYDTASLIQSDYGRSVLTHGNLEVIARTVAEVHHYFRDDNGWHGPHVVAVWSDGAASDLLAGGTPSLIQATNRNLELAAVIAPGVGLAHFYRDADDMRWYGPTAQFGQPTDATLLQRADGRLEALTLEPFTTFIRDETGWRADHPTTTDGATLPSNGLMAACHSVYTGGQSIGISGTNIELVVTGAAHSLDHYWCDNDNPDLPAWHYGSTIQNVPNHLNAVAVVPRSTTGEDLSVFGIADGYMYQWDRWRPPAGAWSPSDLILS